MMRIAKQRWPIGLICVAAVLSPTAGAGASHTVKLNDPLPAGGNVIDYRLSPDGSRAVYRADQDSDDLFELFSVPLDGSAGPTQLNEILLFGARVRDAGQISPDSRRVTFLANLSDAGPYSLFSVPIDGSASPVTLANPMNPTTSVQFTRIAPTGDRVTYNADPDEDGAIELFSVPITGGPSTEFNTSERNGGFFRHLYTPDGSRVVYLGDADGDGHDELLSAPADASGSTLLSGPLAPGQSADFFPEIAPDGSRVVYRVNGEPDSLFSVPVDGCAAPVEMAGAGRAPAGEDFPIQEVHGTFQITPDSSRLVYTADPDGDGANNLLIRPIEGAGSPAALTGAPAVAGDEFLIDFQISPAGDRAVYQANPDDADVFGLFSVPLDGSAPPTPLTDFTAGNPSASADVDFLLTPDGERVVFTGDFEADGVTELFSAPLDGSGDPVRLSDDLIGDAQVLNNPLSSRLDVELTPDGDFVVYAQDDDGDFEADALFAVPVAGGEPFRLNDEMVPGGNIERFRIAPDGSSIAYLADQDTDGVRELYATSQLIPTPSTGGLMSVVCLGALIRRRRRQ